MELCKNDAAIETPMKCRKCRFVLLEYPKVHVSDSHGQLSSPLPFQESSLSGPQNQNKYKLVSCKSDVWYVAEESIPEWIASTLNQGEWLQGKINCPKCNARVGAYNFVTGLRCPCKSQVVPPIHIVKSKVDFTTPMHISPSVVEVRSVLGSDINVSVAK